MARKIIVLERVNIPSDFSFKYVFWLSVPAARQTYNANATASSVVKDATAAELTAIKNGSVVEVTGIAEYLAGTSVPTIQADLINKYNAEQAKLNTANQWQYYGSSWDGTTWSLKSVA